MDVVISNAPITAPPAAVVAAEPRGPRQSATLGQLTPSPTAASSHPARPQIVPGALVVGPSLALAPRSPLPSPAYASPLPGAPDDSGAGVGGVGAEESPEAHILRPPQPERRRVGWELAPPSASLDPVLGPLRGAPPRGARQVRPSAKAQLAPIGSPAAAAGAGGASPLSPLQRRGSPVAAGARSPTAAAGCAVRHGTAGQRDHRPTTAASYAPKRFKHAETVKGERGCKTEGIQELEDT